MTDPDDELVMVELITYDDSDTVETFCERQELIDGTLEPRDVLFGVVTVGKS